MNNYSNIKISVIMPTYNVEKYFRECLNSVVNQTLKDIEIIPVDDGSPDNCGAIMDEYASKDNRIKPIHKKNGGYGSAVNVGIEKAKGQYIAILETDDFVEPNMYEVLYNNAKKNNSDVVKCNFYVYNSFKKKQYQNKIYSDKYNIILNAPNNSFTILKYPLLLSHHASVWAGIYKSEFIKKIKFIKSGYYQDFPFTVEVLCKAKNISIVKQALIHYRSEHGQQSSTFIKDNRVLNMARMVIKAKEILKKYNLYDTIKEEFYYHAFSANNNFFSNVDMKYKKEYFILLKKLFSDIKNNFHYKYFSDKEKKIVLYIIKMPYFIFAIKNNLKQIKDFIFFKYTLDVYRIYRIFNFIKITTKPTALAINMLMKKNR